jgi:hypothetical protein
MPGKAHLNLSHVGILTLDDGLAQNVAIAVEVVVLNDNLFAEH